MFVCVSIRKESQPRKKVTYHILHSFERVIHPLTVYNIGPHHLTCVLLLKNIHEKLSIICFLSLILSRKTKCLKRVEIPPIYKRGNFVFPLSKLFARQPPPFIFGVILNFIPLARHPLLVDSLYVSAPPPRVLRGVLLPSFKNGAPD